MTPWALLPLNRENLQFRVVLAPTMGKIFLRAGKTRTRIRESLLRDLIISQFIYMYSHLYHLFLSTDANFCLKGRLRDTTVQDTCLSPGWSYFVESVAYLEYVAKFANQEEV